MDDVFIAPVRGEVGDETTEGGARVAERGERVGFCRDEVDESEARVFITKELSGDEANTLGKVYKTSNQWKSNIQMIDGAFIIWEVSIDCLSRRVRLVAGVFL